MAKVDRNINALNDKVQIIVYQLESRGECIQHWMVNWFKGYEADSDKEFESYIHLKKYKYNEIRSINEKKVMSHAKIHYMEITMAKELHSAQRKPWNPGT